jgi:hypothetical protein
MQRQIKVGRLGLRIFLPLIQWDYGLSGRKVQVAALVALVNLINAAYPMMPHHGEKIMCELVACWAHANRSLQDAPQMGDEETELCHLVATLATHAATLTLVFSGDSARRALNSMRALELDSSLVEHITDIENSWHQLGEIPKN